MKIKVGAVLVLAATLSLLLPLLGSADGSRRDIVDETRHGIVAVVVGLTGYTIVILGLIGSSPKQRKSASLTAAVLALPALFFCRAGAVYTSIGWFLKLKVDWFGVLAFTLAFVGPALVVAGVAKLVASWCRRRQRRLKNDDVTLPIFFSRESAMRLVAGAILIHAGVTFCGQTLDTRWRHYEPIGLLACLALGGVGLILIASARRPKRDP